ncbi:conserved hypothetical protein [Anaeromyxobacter dehalogenans 2CP-1]|uniref:Lipoprotein n=1 Tax=Anaeromyxobacter dehalogenans (strain ATCC BAA-258 / DSM 21875 / 2CP-1) TaxID=455488 RepID=B8JAQ4_ANAD2|nr:hypothetical protein [Anaeromyxobacter dehalogenans]ACL67553.1 conserved hypothetical protein [Anaeromyxobacter dehalogenans 2CP-1]
MRTVRRLGLAAIVALAGCGRGCGNTDSPFDPSAGYEPLEDCRASFPAPVEGDPHPETLVTVDGDGPEWSWAHGAAYVHVPLPVVWEALQDPATSHIHGADWRVTGTVEPDFPLSFEIRYEAGPSGLRVHWVIAYRGGPLVGTVEAPEVIGFRYQRIHGTVNVEVQDGSLVATDAGDGVTALQFVCHLNAYHQDHDDVRGTVQDWFNDLVAKVRTLQPPP